jgi:class 3 adenylate cyclase
MGNIETGTLAILFAALHPERVSHLVLANTTARYLSADDYPIGGSLEDVDAVVELLASSWGSEEWSRAVLPSYADRPEVIAAHARMMRASATRRAAAAFYRYFMRDVDVRSFLPLVQAPTLVFHSRESLLLPVAHGHYLVEHLPAGPLIEWPGADTLQPDSDQASSDIIEFLTGQRPADTDRVLATVLFTDIVGSTQRAGELGDRKWHAVLDAHDRAVRDQLQRFKGREINTVGDGFFVSFDGPARAIRCAQAIGHATRDLGVSVRMGLHTGECEVRGDDLGGLAVHIAARIGSLAIGQEILVSSTMKDLVIGSGIEFADRGEHDLKGVDGPWKLFAVQP